MIIAIDPGGTGPSGVVAIHGERIAYFGIVETDPTDPFARYVAIKAALAGLGRTIDEGGGVAFVVEDQFLGTGAGSFPATKSVLASAAVWKAEAKRHGLRVLSSVLPSVWAARVGITGKRDQRKDQTKACVAAIWPAMFRGGVSEHVADAALLALVMHVDRDPEAAGILCSHVRPQNPRKATKAAKRTRRTL